MEYTIFIDFVLLAKWAFVIISCWVAYVAWKEFEVN